MFPLFETICIKNGQILNEKWHQKRYEASLKQFYSIMSKGKLLENITIPKSHQTGLCKLKISYNKSNKKTEFGTYKVNIIKTLKVVEDNTIEYNLKYANRDHINKLYNLREDCDDVLIIKNGFLTDSSYANIVFFDGNNWHTPTTPLLKGTARARLLNEGIIQESKIKKEDIVKYQCFKLINAMRDFDVLEATDISKIIL